jgi:hypothetical protein
MCRSRTRIYTPRASRLLLPLIPAIVLRIDIRCYLRRIAEHVLVFAREIRRTCKSPCYLQRAPLILQANLGASGSRNEPVSCASDGMTADFHPFDMGFVGRVATRIINEVVYDVTSKPPRTIEWVGGRGFRSCPKNLL